MTTPIPDAAVAAAAEVLHTGHWCQQAEYPDGCPGPDFYTDVARAALAAALPLLGEHTIEWGVQYANYVRTYSSRDEAEMYAEALQPDGLRHRTVITGPWTEAEK